MHSKQKGNVAEAVTILAMTKARFNVFKELGDYSRIDLIAEKDGRLLRIQCKGAYPKNGVVYLYLKKSGPNYQYKYKITDIDIFALVNLETLDIAFIPNIVLMSHTTSIALRYLPAKNNIKETIINWYNYCDLDRILRDYTPTTWNGDDIVQTTTATLPVYESESSRLIRTSAGSTPASRTYKEKPQTRKVIWPEKEILTKLITTIPISTIAKQYGVSDSAIIKWCKRYNITRPGRGHWAKQYSVLPKPPTLVSL